MRNFGKETKQLGHTKFEKEHDEKSDVDAEFIRDNLFQFGRASR
jgi:hypothetical protein